MGVENLFPFRCHACAVKFYAFLEEETFAGHLPEQIALESACGVDVREPSAPPCQRWSNRPVLHTTVGGRPRRGRTGRGVAGPWTSRCSICGDRRVDGKD